MKDKKIYFENVLNYGNLYLDKVLFAYDNLPIIFVCTDKYHNYYLAICTDSICSLSWMLTGVSISTLISILKNEIPVFEAFKIDNKKIIIIDNNGEKLSCKEQILSEISEDELPDENEYLDANGKLDDYIADLSAISLKVETFEYEISNVQSITQTNDSNFYLQEFLKDDIYLIA